MRPTEQCARRIFVFAASREPAARPTRGTCAARPPWRRRRWRRGRRRRRWRWRRRRTWRRRRWRCGRRWWWRWREALAVEEAGGAAEAAGAGGRRRRRGRRRRGREAAGAEAPSDSECSDGETLVRIALIRDRARRESPLSRSRARCSRCPRHNLFGTQETAIRRGQMEVVECRVVVELACTRPGSVPPSRFWPFGSLSSIVKSSSMCAVMTGRSYCGVQNCPGGSCRRIRNTFGAPPRPATYMWPHAILAERSGVRDLRAGCPSPRGCPSRPESEQVRPDLGRCSSRRRRNGRAGSGHPGHVRRSRP